MTDSGTGTELAAHLVAQGIRFAAGVPCSLLGGLDGALAGHGDVRYVTAAVEGEAVALAAGAWLGGSPAAVLMQNSGLGNAVNVLTSLNRPFGLPALLVVTWRGEPGHTDEPQHEAMGALTPDLLGLLGIPAWVLRPGQALDRVVVEACARMTATSRPVALVVPSGALAPVPHRPPAVRRRTRRARLVDLRTGGSPPSRRSSLRAILDTLPADTAVVAATGRCARELFALGDDPRHFYMVGSMGSAASIGLGLALASGRRVVVLDGDAAALMRLGSFATAGAFGTAALTHVVLDNGGHGTTGGQPSAAPNVDFAAVAASCGYGAAATTDDLASLGAALAVPTGSGPRLVHHRIGPDAAGAPPRVPRDLPGIGDRFRAFAAVPA